MENFTFNGYISSRFNVNRAGVTPQAIATGTTSAPFLELSTNTDGFSWSCHLPNITPEDLEALAAELRAGMVTWNSLNSEEVSNG